MQKYYVDVHGTGEAVPPSTRWYLDPNRTILHRIGGPAVEYADGDFVWYVNGKRHRTDGPTALINGDKYWYLNDRCHREDGPAIERSNGSVDYVLNGLWVSATEHARRTAPAKEMTVAQIEAALGHKVKVVK